MNKKKNVEGADQDKVVSKLEAVTERVESITEKLQDTKVKKTTNGFSYGSDLPDYLTVLFVAFKLTGIISWSWVWVLAPFWIPAVIALIAAVSLSIALWRDTKVSGEPKQISNG